MAHDATLVPQPTASRAAGADEPAPWPELASERNVVFAVDVRNALIVAASPAARTALAIRAIRPLPMPIDSAMPALKRLREIAADPDLEDALESLAFWTFEGGIVFGDWHLSQTDTSAIILVRGALDAEAPDAAIEDADAQALAQFDSPIPAIDGEGGIEPADVAEAEPRRRDDADTLKEIARQIRERQAAVQARFANPPAANDVARPPPPDAMTEKAVVEDGPPEMRSDGLLPHDLARLSHELKTPLTAIASAAEIMRDETLGPMGNERYLGYARDIHESAKHALAVISRMLGSAIASERDRDSIEAIDLNELVGRTVATLQPLADERRITLEFDAADGDPVVTASPTALRQALLNLLTNALKFTPPRGDVRAATGYLPSGGIYLVVRDTGIGIDEALLRSALSGVTAPIAERPGGGHGMGLPIVCRLVAEMGAEIEFDTAPGRGTVAMIMFGGRRGYPI